jgi:hypothetical protein
MGVYKEDEGEENQILGQDYEKKEGDAPSWANAILGAEERAFR